METDDTILDKVLSSKRTQEMERFAPSEIVPTLLKELTEREAEVLRRRFGLNGKAQETLEEIGAQHRVTRERIRQIQNTAIHRMRSFKQASALLEPVVSTIMDTLTRHGGIMEEQALLQELFQLSNDTPVNRQCVLFIMSELMKDKVQLLRETASLQSSWRLLTASMILLEGTIQALETLIKNVGQPMERRTLLEKFRDDQFFKSHEHQLTDEMILSYLQVSRSLARNPFGEYGLADWGAIVPKRINDKILLILRKEGKPLHFQEITRRINESSFDKRVAYGPTVHNELILNNEYVLVGRGIYALREWGYKPGVVADVIEGILRSHEGPIDRQTLVNEVLKQRLVKRNTIHLALTDRHRFHRLPDGRYTVADLPSASDAQPSGKS